jgi:hypothetical protein
MRMSKKALNLLIEADLVQKAREKGIAISKFLENKLQEYFTFIDAISKTNTLSSDAGNGIRTRVSSLGS